jgi:biotin synthase
MLSIRSIFRPHIRLNSIILSSLSYSSSSAAAIQAEKTIKDGPRNDWTREEIKDVYDSPLLDLLFHGVRSFYSVM